MGLDPRLAALLRGQHGVVSRAQARRLGLSDDAVDGLIERNELRPLFRGVLRAASAPATPAQMLHAVVVWAGAGAALSHRSAGGLLRLDGVPPGYLDVTVTRKKRSPDNDVKVYAARALTDSDVIVVRGLAVTAPARTLVDLAAVMSEPAVEIALDSAVRRGALTIAKLREEVAGPQRGRAGVAMIRRLLDLRHPQQDLDDSALETLMFRLLRRFGLPSPVAQLPVGPYRCDFAYPRLLIAIEVVGFDPHGNRPRFDHDADRFNYLQTRGWLVLTLTWTQITQRPQEVAARIREAIAIRSVRS